jgi:nucleoside-diphosphate-sugar epimerase
MRVFLAGSTGVLGRRIIPLLAGQGHEVTALTRRSDQASVLRSLGAQPAVADVFERESLAAAVKLAAPDAVIHQLTDLASGTSASNAVLRVRGTRNLMDAAHDVGAGRVISQSIAWAYAAGCGPAAEEIPLDLGAAEPRLTTINGIATLEQMTQEAPQWVVLRYGILYGPDSWFEPHGSKAADARAGHLPADSNVSSFVHVDDAAAAAVQALTWPSGPVNICDDEPATGRQWVPAFCQAVGAPMPIGSNSDAREPWARGADNRHARTHLAWAPRFPSWRQGFHDMRSVADATSPRLQQAAVTGKARRKR